MKNRKSAFTLAEVLVTLGIIGVVSAMTIPSLTQNWQRKAYVTQLKKSYSEISQALESVISDNNALNLSEAGVNYNSVRTFTNNYFKKAKDCGGSPSGCFAGNYKTINGGYWGTPWGSSCFVTAGGASICMTNYNAFVDINGQKGPNIVGRDFFAFNIDNRGGLYGEANGSYHNSNCKNTNHGATPYYCSSAVIDSGWEMKY